jgi:hypothetical protein
LPPVRELLREARILRERFPHDRKVTAICDAFEETTKEMLDAGYTLRSGGGEKIRPMELPPELEPYRAQWARTPPENPGEK